MRYPAPALPTPPRILAIAAAVLLTAALSPGARAQLGSADGLPPAVARGDFLATAAGPAAGITLPAASAFVPDNRALISVELLDDRFAGFGILWQPGRLMLEYRHIDRRPPGLPSYNEDHYAVGLTGRRGPWVFAGDAAWYANDVVGAPGAFTVGLSAGIRPHRTFSFVIRGLHLNEPDYVGGPLPRTIAAGFAARVLGPRLAVAADLYFREDGHDDFALRYGLESELVTGFYLAAAATNEGRFNASVAYRQRKEQSGYGFSGDFDGGQRQHLFHLGHEENPPQPEVRGKRVIRHLPPGSSPSR